MVLVPQGVAGDGLYPSAPSSGFLPIPYKASLPKTILDPFFFFFFFLYRASPAAYGSSQARDQIGASVSSLCHNHSITGSKPSLQSTPQLTSMPHILNPMSKARDRTHILLTRWTTMGTPSKNNLNNSSWYGKSLFHQHLVKIEKHTFINLVRCINLYQIIELKQCASHANTTLRQL